MIIFWGLLLLVGMFGTAFTVDRSITWVERSFKLDLGKGEMMSIYFIVYAVELLIVLQILHNNGIN